MSADINTLSLMAAIIYAQGGLDEPTAVQVAHSLAERAARRWAEARKAKQDEIDASLMREKDVTNGR